MGYNKVDPTEDMIQEILNKVDQNHSGHIKLHNKISFEKLVILTTLYTLGIRAASQKNQSGISLLVYQELKQSVTKCGQNCIKKQKMQKFTP